MTPEPRAPLTRDRVLRAAVTLADEHGIAALGMRPLGAALGVQAMSLYNHVANKDAILDGIVDHVVGEIGVPSRADGWPTAMQRRAFSAHDALMRHAWACPLLMARVNVGPNMLRYIDGTLACLLDAGFSLPMADHAWNAMDSYIYGFTLHKLNFPFKADEYAQVATGYLPRLSKPDYPAMHAMTSLVATGGHDGLHDLSFGLDMILDGLGRLRR